MAGATDIKPYITEFESFVTGGLVTFYWRIFEHPNGTGQCS